jgi:hypothetical protein
MNVLVGGIFCFWNSQKVYTMGIFPLASKFGWSNIGWIICLDTDTIRYSWPLHKIINQAIGRFPSELGPWHGDEATTIALNDSGPWHARKGAGRRAKIGPAGGERWPATDRVGSRLGRSFSYTFCMRNGRLAPRWQWNTTWAACRWGHSRCNSALSPKIGVESTTKNGFLQAIWATKNGI